MNAPNLIGQEFGKLIVIEREYEYPLTLMHKRAYWKCLCRCCNKVILASTTALHSGKKLSCKTNYLEKGEAGFNFLFRNYKNSAKNRELDFTLTKEEFKELTKGDCFYCGNSPSQIHRKEKDIYIYNGIDRIDSLKGYIKNNCISCCGTCNMAKRVMSQREFILWIKKVYKNLEKRGDLI